MGTRLHRPIVTAMLPALAVAFPVLANDMRGIGLAMPGVHQVERDKEMAEPVPVREVGYGFIAQVPADIGATTPAPASDLQDSGPPVPGPDEHRNYEAVLEEVPVPVRTADSDSIEQLPAGAAVSLPALEFDVRKDRASGQSLLLMPRHAEVVVRARAGIDEPIRPIPADLGTDPQKVALGRALFHDPRLSKDNTTACVSCHDLGSGGDDGRKVSVGVEGRLGPINAPTVFNVALNFKQFWDGRADTLTQQIDGPVQSPLELGTLWPDVIEKLYRHESYPARFEAVYPDGISRDNVKDALAEFMTSLTTPNSSFDRWLKGDEEAIDAQQKRGYALFKHYGCSSCHQGANVGGNMFQVFGVLNEYFRKRGDITEADLGRYNVTGNPVDRHAFKVPSLRMAALTAPYLHDGSAETLRDAVDAMFEFQLGREAPDEDKEDIVAFIRSLAGESKELDP